MKTSTERVRAYRNRRRETRPPKRPPKPPKQRAKEYRMRLRARRVLFSNWNDTKIVMFLTIFESYDVLWDANHKDHDDGERIDKNYEKFLKDLKTIGLLEMDADVDLVKTIIEIIKATISGDAKMDWFDSAKFLMNNNEVEPPIQHTVDSTYLPPLIKIEIEDEDEQQVQDEFASSNTINPSECIPLNEEYMQELESSTTCETTDETKDACTYFGKYVAAELRSFPLRTRLEIQREIQNCLISAVIRGSRESIASGTAKANF